MRILNRFALMFPVDVVINHTGIERTRAIEREDSDKIVKTVRTKPADHIGNAARFQLKDPDRSSGTDQLIGFWIVQREPFKFDRLAECLLDQPGSFMENSQGFKPEEVEFYQADLLNVTHRELGNDLVVFIEHQRQQLNHRPIGNNNTRGVGRSVARKPFKFAGEID